MKKDGKKHSKTVREHEKKHHGMKSGGKVKVRGCGSATKGKYARGPMA